MWNKNSNLFAAFIAIVAWTTVLVQLYVNINSKLNPLSETVIRFFSYFTILTNILVAICTTTIAMNRNNFFSRYKTLAATAVYITIVSLIYNVILRSLWKFSGTQWYLNELEHVVVPVLFLLFWLVMVPKNTLQFKNALPWTIYPLVYLITVMLRGNASGFYPYPFIDASQLSNQQLIINCLMVCASFIVISLLFIGFGKVTSGKKTDLQTERPDLIS